MMTHQSFVGYGVDELNGAEVDGRRVRAGSSQRDGPQTASLRSLFRRSFHIRFGAQIEFKFV